MSAGAAGGRGRGRRSGRGGAACAATPARPAGRGAASPRPADSAWERLLIERWARPWILGSKGDLPPEVSALVVTLGVGFLSRDLNDRLEDRREWGSFTLGRYGGALVAANHRRGGTFELELLMRSLPGAGGISAVIGLGAAGALDDRLEPGDLLVATRAGRGEGLSAYYLQRGEEAAADDGLRRRLEEALAAAPARRGDGAPPAPGPAWRSGPVFTTGALLRETPRRIAGWRAAGFCAVECEAAALFALSRFCGLPAALLLVITDSPARGTLAGEEPELSRLRAGAAMAVEAVLAVAATVTPPAGRRPGARAEGEPG